LGDKGGKSHGFIIKLEQKKGGVCQRKVRKREQREKEGCGPERKEGEDIQGGLIKQNNWGFSEGEKGASKSIQSMKGGENASGTKEERKKKVTFAAGGQQQVDYCVKQKKENPLWELGQTSRNPP